MFQVDGDRVYQPLVFEQVGTRVAVVGDQLAESVEEEASQAQPVVLGLVDDKVAEGAAISHEGQHVVFNFAVALPPHQVQASVLRPASGTGKSL